MVYMAVAIAGFIHGKVSIYSNRTVRQKYPNRTVINNIAKSVKFLLPDVNLRVAMSFFRFGILPENLQKHALQISVLHTSLVVTLTIAITWPDQ